MRFKEFTDNWKQVKIGECLDIKYGKDYKHLNPGKYPILGTGGVMGYVDDYLYSGESILIGRKGTIDKPKFINGSFWTVDTLFYSEINKGFPKFLFYNLSNINWLKYNEASGVPSLSANNIKNVKIKIPKLKEQEKIAKFLTNIDKKIENLEIKYRNYQEFKKYLLQNIFSQKLRFKGFEDDWFDVRFKDLGNIVSGIGFSKKYQGHLDLDINVFKVSDMNLEGNEKYMVKSNNTVDKNICKEMNVKPITEPAIIFAKVGEAIFLNRKRIVSDSFIIDNNMMSLIPNNKISIEFLYYLCLTLNFGKYAQVGALPSYNASDIYSIKTKIPSLEEQEKIASFLSSVDQKIDLINDQISKTETFKKGLLQSMVMYGWWFI